MERIFSALIALSAVFGLACHLRASTPDGRRATFLYYTNLSNLAAAAYQLALLIFSFFPDSAAARALELPGTRLSMTLCIAVTGIVYWAVLAPGAARRGEQLAAGRTANLLLHGAVPALSLLQWLLCADKAVTPADAARWLAVPAAYFAFILIRARLRGPIPGRSSAYPYHFMNLERLGAGRFWRNIALMMAAFFALGLAFVGLARLLLRCGAGA